MICGSGGSKSRLAKAAGAEPSGQMRDEKLHAVVARSTFRSQNVQNTCSGPLLEVEMSKKCTPLWREAHFEVENVQKCTLWCEAHFQSRTTFGSWDVEKVHAVVARSTFPSQNVTKHTRGFGPLFVEKVTPCRSTFRSQNVKNMSFRCFRVAGARDCAPCQKWAKREGFVAVSTTTTLHSNTLRHNSNYTTFHYNYNYTFTTFHYTTLHSTTTVTLHYTLHHTTPHHTTLTLHYTTILHYTTLQLRYTTLHITRLH